MLLKYLSYALMTSNMLFCIFILAKKIFIKHSDVSEKEKHISKIIYSASFTYLYEQYKYIFYIFLIMLIPIHFLLNDYKGFIIGFILSVINSYISMFISLKSNLITLYKVKKSVNSGFIEAISSSFVSTYFITSLSLLTGVIGLNLYNKNILLGIILGISTSATLARLGGGIFTKGADIAADLSGKLEYGFTEDDIRNPAVIADASGDNVGDCVATSSDSMDSIVSVLLLLIFMFGVDLGYSILLIFGLSIHFNTISFLAIKYYYNKIDIYKSIKIFNYINILFNSLIILIPCRHIYGINLGAKLCFISGILVTYFIYKISNYISSSKNKIVKDLYSTSKLMTGLNLIRGLSYGYIAAPIMLLVFVISVSIVMGTSILKPNCLVFYILGILSSFPSILTQDLLGPISDNAGTIAVMSGVKDSVRTGTDKLDELGNTTKAASKNYLAMASLIVSIIIIYGFWSQITNLAQTYSYKWYVCVSSIQTSNSILLLIKILSIMLGGMMPLLFSGVTMYLVTQAAYSVIEDIKDQIGNNKNILLSKQKPNYNRTIKVLTNCALKYVGYIILLPVTIPIIYLILMGPILLLSYIKLDIGNIYYFSAHMIQNLTLFMASNSAMSVCTAIYMIVSGGLFDNCKKYTKSLNNYDPATYKSTVIGDVLGDPLKDTTGPGLCNFAKFCSLICFVYIYSLNCALTSNHIKLV